MIGVLGTFACYKKNSAKERQLVLDDIEIELKMCERYLKLAEEKNDMKAIRQIEIIQRNLLRQQQRIKYKMKVYYNQNTPSVNKDEDYMEIAEWELENYPNIVKAHNNGEIFYTSDEEEAATEREDNKKPWERY